MNRFNRRRLLGGLTARVLGLGLSAGLITAPARASKPKPAAKSRVIKFDISVSKFREMCTLAGGQSIGGAGDPIVCYMKGWRMECDKATGRCRIDCDRGVKCVKAKSLPPGASAALNKAAAKITVAR